MAMATLRPYRARRDSSDSASAGSSRPPEASPAAAAPPSPPRRKSAPLRERRFVDELRVRVQGGHGGAGCCSFRKSRHDRHGRADGGNGGQGGDVVLVADPAVWDLANVPQHVAGGKGSPGISKRQVGRRGADQIVRVPVGTVAWVLNGALPDGATASWNGEGGQLPAVSPIPVADWDDNNSCVRQEAVMAQAESRNEVMAGSVGIDMSCSGSSTRVSNSEGHGGATAVPEAGGNLQESLSGPRAANGPSLPDGDRDEVEGGVAEVTGPRWRATTATDVDLATEGATVRVGAGGAGGRGNAVAPRSGGLPSRESAEQGRPGSAAVLALELRTVADVGLVGLPNAGKSTLLAALTRAAPATAHYAFTTLRPHLGMLRSSDGDVPGAGPPPLVIADIPGLVPGAAAGRGRGHAFLRHVERARGLALVLDMALPAADGVAAAAVGSGLTPVAQLTALAAELEAYRPGLGRRVLLVVATKMDEPGAAAALACLRPAAAAFKLPVMPVCAVLGDGVPELAAKLQELFSS
eukprot:SM000034S12740  [mRNA]  locus=s34:519739:522688:+ [translate_table: standard]